MKIELEQQKAIKARLQEGRQFNLTKSTTQTQEAIQSAASIDPTKHRKKLISQKIEREIKLVQELKIIVAKLNFERSETEK